ncbi:MAG: outer membrane beta-barrel protein [Brevundimonas sp.]|uniref:outer membrane beta-barrel protein n=1 Tax=Brevundimonas sp. TaxID=1871086 RepID=UPI002734A7E1|nr:outer membrane beta-barrel protein [Brevundimonas sp.]MDP3406189.1 outer membrane beta-barrel protein [Brevundimonas sp.]
MAVTVSAGSLALVCGAAVAQTASGSLAGARDAGVDNFSRNRNTSVAQRSRPDYEAPGIRAGAFLVYPRLELSAERNDNIYATAANEVDDSILHVRPELAFESDWSQNFLTAYVRGAFNRYSDNESENTEEFGVGGSGRIDVTRLSNLGFGADYNSSFEPRTAPSAPRNAVEPTALKTAQAYISGSRSAGYLKLTGRADWRSFDYEDGRTGLGAVIEQDNRDREVVSLSGRLDLAVSPDTAFFFQATGNDRTYDIRSTPLAPARDSKGAEYLFGANFELGAVARGEISAGYIEQSFDEAAFDDVEGFGARAQLEWFPSELTTVNIAAGRTVEDTPVAGVGAFVSNTASLGIDHELLRNVILNARVTWGRDEYEGIDREDTRTGVNIGGTYLINRNFGVNATLSSMDTKSEGANRDQDFTVNKLIVALVSQF